MADEIRKHPNPFSQYSIDEAISKIPEDKKGAVVLYSDIDGTSMRFGVVAKVNDNWSFVGNLEKEWSGPWSAHGEAIWSWN